MIRSLDDDGGGRGTEGKGINSGQNLEVERAGSDFIYPLHLWQSLDK